MKSKNTPFPVVIAATHVKELNAVELSENQIRFGASVTLNRTDQTLRQAISQLHGLCYMTVIVSDIEDKSLRNICIFLTIYSLPFIVHYY